MLSTNSLPISDGVGDFVPESNFIDSNAPDLHWKQVKLMAMMLDHTKKAVNQFLCFQWQKRGTLESVLLPHILYIPSHLQDALFQNFHTIHSHADLADILLEWELVDSDSDLFGLFNVVQECNRVFDNEHTAKKIMCNQNAAVTHQMKAAAASASGPTGM